MQLDSLQIQNELKSKIHSIIGIGVVGRYDEYARVNFYHYFDLLCRFAALQEFSCLRFQLVTTYAKEIYHEHTEESQLSLGKVKRKQHTGSC